MNNEKLINLGNLRDFKTKLDEMLDNKIGNLSEYRNTNTLKAREAWNALGRNGYLLADVALSSLDFYFLEYGEIAIGTKIYIDQLFKSDTKEIYLVKCFGLGKGNTLRYYQVLHIYEEGTEDVFKYIKSDVVDDSVDGSVNVS